MNGWISVNDDLPMDGETVLANVKGWTVGFMTLVFEVYEVYEDKDLMTEEEWRQKRYGFYQPYSPWKRYDLNDIDYWMIIPELPKNPVS